MLITDYPRTNVNETASILAAHVLVLSQVRASQKCSRSLPTVSVLRITGEPVKHKPD